MSAVTELVNKVYQSIHYQPSTDLIDLAHLHLDVIKSPNIDIQLIFDQAIIHYLNHSFTGLIINNQNIQQLSIKRQHDSQTTLIHILPYVNKQAVNDLSDPINVSQIIQKLLSELVFYERTNNVIVPLIYTDVYDNQLTNYSFGDLIKKDTIYSVQWVEKFYSWKSLHYFLQNYPLTEIVLNTIIYQAMEVLYQITSIYPSFRYNQFIPEMIGCYLCNENGITFPELKLDHFCLSQIKDLVPNNYLQSNQINIPYVDTNYSDFYQLLNYLWNYHQSDIIKYPQIIALFDQLLPASLRTNDIYLTTAIWDSLPIDIQESLNLEQLKKLNLCDPILIPKPSRSIAGNNLSVKKYFANDIDNMDSKRSIPKQAAGDKKKTIHRNQQSTNNEKQTSNDKIKKFSGQRKIKFNSPAVSYSTPGNGAPTTIANTLGYNPNDYHLQPVNEYNRIQQQPVNYPPSYAANPDVQSYQRYLAAINQTTSAPVSTDTAAPYPVPTATQSGGGKDFFFQNHP